MKPAQVHRIPMKMDAIKVVDNPDVPALYEMDIHGLGVQMEVPSYRTIQLLIMTAGWRYYMPLQKTERDLIDKPFHQFNEMLNKEISTLVERGIHVYLSEEDGDVKMKVKDRILTCVFEYQINEENIYSAYFVNGVTDEAVQQCIKYAQTKGNKFIDALFKNAGYE